MFRVARLTSLARVGLQATQKRQIAIISDQSANIGDYPTNVPAINRQTKSEVVKYDNQQDRRNFGETVTVFRMAARGI